MKLKKRKVVIWQMRKMKQLVEAKEEKNIKKDNDIKN